ncbi:hypothetical protein HBZS_123170 [Helicobacter bizzozeronii CCUG 35545]|nr:hypothetical protein HBZS_123170 [Helicobacter bizzozeronii CCUG 35545]
MRFLVLALLLGTLGATTPPTLLDIAQKLESTMESAIDQGNPDLTRNNAAIDSLPVIQKLGEQFFNQVSLLQRFKPRNEQEKTLCERAKTI